MFLFFDIEDLTSEENSGHGRYDFGFPNINSKEEKGYVLIEVKAYKPYNKNVKPISEQKIKSILHKECIDALNQIETKDYSSKYRFYGYTSFIKYGIAFYEKYCKIAMKINDGEIQNSSFIYSEEINNNDNNDNNNNNNNNNNSSSSSSSSSSNNNSSSSSSSSSSCSCSSSCCCSCCSCKILINFKNYF